MMKWNHLPVAGGLYDQHPKLIEEWSIIFHEKNEYEANEAAKEKSRAAHERNSAASY